VVDDAFSRCAEIIAGATGLLVTAGAGIGVDSGLPDFRGNEGFWRAYPALAKARIRFGEIARPDAIRRNPALGWGFYGHRLALYRRTVPHEGFSILRQLGEGRPQGVFVFTSNVDGQFQKAGFAPEAIVEVHGSLHWLQCLEGCGAEIWPATDFSPEVDERDGRLTSDLPRCPRCSGIARPNVLMFDDGEWVSARLRLQWARLNEWLSRIERLAVIEIGAGRDIPTVRMFSESNDGLLIRINPREADVPGLLDIGLPMGGLEALRGIREAMAAPTGIRHPTREGGRA
jgi:NAD-dependent SIR2 family protein deacetylase